MTYVQGFVLAVPADKKDAYQAEAARAAPIFKEFGALRQVEAWADDVPDGTVTDFRGAVLAKPDEAVVFSWIEYPSKAVCDAAQAKLTADARMEDMTMPFDGQRMIFAGFEPIVEAGPGGAMGYTDGFLVPVPDGNREAYRTMAETASAVFRDHGALRVVEAWGDGLPEGKVTDYRRAVKAEDGENVVFSWVEWPSKEARDDGWKKVMADARLNHEQSAMPFDGKRMIYGGFAPILDV